ncbi:MAG TPA: fumarylacetoacetate hydrolase family protein [Sphingomonadaceae bacterium]|nr:fumarylacetoacetate hydrolase family protein [Sphingomonadaceae bacterium]
MGGTVYGVVLNDRVEREALAPAFGAKPYAAPPVAPVVYLKPRGCVTTGGAPVPVPAGLDAVQANPTIALLFDSRPGVPVAAALALDICEPHPDYYRPAIRQRCRDGFLPLGGFAAFDPALAAAEIETRVDGAVVHRWSLTRLVRDPATLIADLAGFMTLSDGDILMVGLPGDAPLVGVGQSVALAAAGLPPLATRIEREQTA